MCFIEVRFWVCHPISNDTFKYLHSTVKQWASAIQKGGEMFDYKFFFSQPKLSGKISELQSINNGCEDKWLGTSYPISF